MKRNQIKIVSNSNIRGFSYFFQNEKGEWNPVTDSSPLSRDNYTTLPIRENADKILQVINDTYNPGNRGVDIYFEGSDKDFESLCIVASENFFGSISCYKRNSIAIAGKAKAGKTTLISELVAKRGYNLQTISKENLVEHSEDETGVTWYEMPSIDSGLFDELSQNGITSLVYCLYNYKIEKPEEDFIRHVREQYPGVKVIIALTRCLEEDTDEMVNEVKRCVGEVEIIPVLARDYPVRNGVIAAYGVDEIIQLLFSGE
jgi:nucleoside-triphosphatase THEP1